MEEDEYGTPPAAEPAAPVDPLEGRTATNPKTGQKVVYRAGAWHAVEGTYGMPLPDTTAKRVEDDVSVYASLKNASGGFKDEFAGNTITGELENKMQGATGWGSEGQRDWWAKFRSADNLIRNQLFGAALTPAEKQAYEATTVDPSMDPGEVKRNLASGQEIVRSALARRTAYLKENGYRASAVDALLGEYAPDLSPKPQQKDGQGSADQPAANASATRGTPPAARPIDPSGQGDIGFASRDAAEANSRPDGSDAYVREVNAGIASGTIKSTDDLIAVAAKYNFSFPDRAAVDKTFEALKKGARFGGASPAEMPVDISADRGKSAVGDTVKAFARGIPAVVGLDDELNAGADVLLNGADWKQSLARERAIRNYDEDNHFWARLGGEIVGGGGIEAGIARAARALTAETAARVAARSMMRAGGTRTEAITAANQAYAIRLMQQGAAVGGVQGAGASDGGFVDRAAGGVAGTAIGAAIGGATGKVAGRFRTLMEARKQGATQPAVSQAAEIARLADEQGISILPQDIGGPGVGRMTQGAAQTPFGGRVISEASERLYNSFRNRVSAVGGDADTLADVGGTMKGRSAALAEREGIRADDTSGAVQRAVGSPDDMTGAGQVVQRGVARFMDETADRASQLYARVPIPGGAEATVGATRGVLRDLNAGMRSNPELGAMFESPRLQGYLRALTPRTDDQTGEVTHTGTLSWQDLQEFRTRVGDMLDDPRLSDKIAPRQLRALYGALSDDMEATARGQGENALRYWRRANTYYAARMKRVNDTLSMVVGERRDKTPNEAMAKLQTMLRAGSGDDAASFGRVMRSIPTEDAQIVRATIVNDMRGGRQFDPAELSKRSD